MVPRSPNKKSLALAKISRPKLSGAFPRERLFRLLDELRDYPVVWVCGPPGGGKTALVASYLEARGLSGIWYRLDQGDTDIASFFYYIGLAATHATAHNRTLLSTLTAASLPDLAGFSRR